MIYSLKTYEKLCKCISQYYKKEQLFNLELNDSSCLPTVFLMLKHDVETNVGRALKIAKIESKYGLSSIFYVQAYLLNKKKNIRYLKKIKDLHHVVSYHHDVMDSNKGDIQKALLEFESNVEKFNNNGFVFKSVCQHGNPFLDRNGYHSNRDFFRSAIVTNKYPQMIDIMVNFPEKVTRDYLYISDAGRSWNVVDKPTENDILNTCDKPIPNIEVFLKENSNTNSVIISTHPHRYSLNVVFGFFHLLVFKIIRAIVKLMIKIPFFKRIIKKHYGVAKKF